MKKNEILEMLNPAIANEDIDAFDCKGILHIEVNDFEGFDENWCEVDHDYNEDLVDNIYETLKAKADKIEEGYYTKFYFNDVVVQWGYSSYDI